MTGCKQELIVHNEFRHRTTPQRLYILQETVARSEIRKSGKKRTSVRQFTGLHLKG